MAVKKVLVPLSLTGNEKKVVDFVANKFLMGGEIDITLFHAYTRVPEVDVEKDPIMGKIIENLSYQRQLLADKENELTLMRRELMKRGLTPGQVHVLFTPIRQNIPRDIIQIVKSEKFDAVVLCRNPGSITGFLPEARQKWLLKKSEKVLTFLLSPDLQNIVKFVRRTSWLKPTN